jgi:formylglycine-generating enzyme required for sulfatase activity
MPFKLIVTSRSKDYFDDRESSLGTVPHYFMSKFSPRQMNLAVEQWHNAVKTRATEYLQDHGQFLDTVEARKRGIKSVLRDNPDLAAVCLTPLMLSVLQTVFADGHDLVSSVSQLCWRAVRWFLVEKHKQRMQEAFVSSHAHWIVDIMVELGWNAHQAFVAGQSKYLSNEDLRRAARSTCPHSEILSADYETLEDAITEVVAFIRRGHGILISLSNNEFDFAHGVFREVLAGRALGSMSIPERRKLALNESWQAAIRYWAGLRAAEPDGLHEISAFVGELSQDISAGIVLAILAKAEMLVEVCSIVPREKLTIDLTHRVSEARGELVSLLQQDDISIGRRIQVGDLLSTLGDPRLQIDFRDRIQWIGDGEYQVGRNENHKTRIAKYQSCPAAPPIKGRLSRFGIGRYLVTNEEFGEFIDNSGYTIKRYWPFEIGWNWACGDRSTVEMLLERARAVAPTHLSSELASQRLVPDEIPERCVQMIDRRLPMCWSDPAFNRANQPIVGINWWEAVAYCRWLDERLSKAGTLASNDVVRLPIEAEWETTARLCGEGNIYPWIGSDPSKCALVKAAFQQPGTSPIFRSCAVGLFESVETHLRVFDLVGNVWEWTASKAVPYSRSTFVQAEDDDGFEDRIARGSSWLSSEEESPQITFRSFDPPYNAYEDLGFRVVLVT